MMEAYVLVEAGGYLIPKLWMGQQQEKKISGQSKGGTRRELGLRRVAS